MANSMHTADGDNQLSSSDRQLWSLTYECLLRFQCPVMFKVHGPDARLRIDRHIQFFVPTEHPLAHKVVAFLQTELEDETRASTMIGDNWVFGTTVTISECRGVVAYTDKPTRDRIHREMAENILADLMTRVKPPNRRDN